MNNYVTGCGQSDKFCVNLEAKYGALQADFGQNLDLVRYKYNYGNKSSLTLESASLPDLNQVLQSLMYSNTKYEPKVPFKKITNFIKKSFFEIVFERKKGRRGHNHGEIRSK